MFKKCIFSILFFFVFLQLRAVVCTWDGISWSPAEPTAADRVIINGALNISDMSLNYLECQSIQIKATITMNVNDSYINVVGGLGLSSITIGIATPLVATATNTAFRVTLGIFDMSIISNNLTIPSGMRFEIDKTMLSNNFLTNNLLILESGAYMYGYSGLGTELSNIIGSVTVKQTGSSLYYKYNAWSSPVENADLTTVFSGVPAADIYQFSDGGTTSGAYSNATGIMTEGRGYFVVGNATSTREFVGEVNDGTVSVALSSSGWTLLGNPYPGLLNFPIFHSSNSGALGASYYFYVDDNSGGSGYATDDYATYNAVSRTGVAANGSTTPTGIVPSCQGFFNDAGSAGIVNFYEDHLSNNINLEQSFYKQPSTYGRVWLNLLDADSNFSEMAIVFGDSLLPGLDDGDSKKKLMPGSMSIHTYLNNTPYVMQAYPFPAGNQVIDLGIITHDSSVYEISLKHHENLAAGAKLILEDIDSNIMHDLSTGPYSVLLPKDSITGRFFLHVQPLATDIKHELIEKADLISCYYNSGTIFINGTKNIDVVESISIYDLSGRLQHFENLSSSSYKYIIPYNIKGINIVQIRTKTGIIYKRIFI
jgi:hypothetical protein